MQWTVRTPAAVALAVAFALSLSAMPAAAFSLSQDESAPGSTERGAEEPGPGERASELALESIRKLMRAMELLLDSIPQYEAPEVLDNGDIIIRRKPDEQAPSGSEDPAAPDQKET